MTLDAVSSHVAPRSLWRTMVPAMTIGGLLAFVFWTLPTWNIFWRTLTHFSVFWHLPSNRLAMLLILLKILAPLPIMLLIGSLLLLSEALKPVQEEPAPRHLEAHRALLEIVQQATHPLPVPPDLDGAPPRTLPATPTRHPLRPLDPVTPLPPVLDGMPAITLPEGLTERPLQPLDPITPLPPVLASPEPAEPARKDAGTLQNASLVLPLTRVASPVAAQPLTLVQDGTTSHHLLSIRLLKEVSISVCLPGGGMIAVSFPAHAKRLLLLAYLAWRRGEMIDRDKILEHIFGWGLPDEEATEEKLAERFESHKKILRRRIREVVQTQVNAPAGTLLIDPDIDPFVNTTGYWGLSGICRVEDIEAVEAAYKVIAHARKEGKLVDEVPAFVKDACDQLLAAYSGDFLDLLMKTYPAEFRPFQGRSSWARKPFTQLRDCYLEAVWYAALYEEQQGQRNTWGTPEEEASGSTQHASGRAAEWYYQYAMDACNTKFDAKVTIGAQGDAGERIGMSERAIRRCVTLLGTMGRTEHVNQVWSSYATQMKNTFDQRWTPSKETLADVEAARAQTSAHRFAARLSSAYGPHPSRQEGENQHDA